MKIIRAHKRAISCVTFSPDGTRLAIGGAGGVLKVIDTTTANETFSTRIEGMFPGKIRAVFLSKGSRICATNFRIHVFDLDSASHEEQGIETVAYFRLAHSPDHTELWAAGDGGVVHYSTDSWESLALPPIARSRTARMTTWPGVAVSSCGNLVALSRKSWSHNSNRDAVFVCSTKTNDVRFTTDWQGHEAKNLSFHPDGTFLAATCGPVLRVWSLTTFAEVAAIKVGALHFMAAAFSPCGRYLGTVSNDGTTRFWLVNAWNESKTYAWDIGKLQDLAFSPDGTTAAVGSNLGKVLLFDVD